MWFPTVLLAVLVVVTEQVIAKGPLLGIDRWVRGQLLAGAAANPYPILNTYARWWTHFGSPSVAVSALTVVTLAAAAWTRSWKPMFSAAIAGIALFATVIPGKVLIGRPGPEGWVVGPGDMGWYPSGHTSTATICYGTAAWLLASSFPLSSRLRSALYAATAALCASVGFLLMWCDFHWFLDVLGGLCLSGVILWSLVRWAPRAQRSKRPEPSERTQPESR
ncbi:phosphatase PAP2 family protein [Streptacidiphilus sp. N1-12]|uniref:Phosphatase PAP2 family protein n=2 Tax=Streptacidiphilus alkalitolerans TaxID=3342712 RepID=A0ABV6WSF3_9ACTN